MRGVTYMSTCLQVRAFSLTRAGYLGVHDPRAGAGGADATSSDVRRRAWGIGVGVPFTVAMTIGRSASGWATPHRRVTATHELVHGV